MFKIWTDCYNQAMCNETDLAGNVRYSKWHSKAYKLDELEDLDIGEFLFKKQKISFMARKYIIDFDEIRQDLPRPRRFWSKFYPCKIKKGPTNCIAGIIVTEKTDKETFYQLTIVFNKVDVSKKLPADIYYIIKYWVPLINSIIQEKSDGVVKGLREIIFDFNNAFVNGIDCMISVYPHWLHNIKGTKYNDLIEYLVDEGYLQSGNKEDLPKQFQTFAGGWNTGGFKDLTKVKMNFGVYVRAIEYLREKTEEDVEFEKFLYNTILKIRGYVKE